MSHGNLDIPGNSATVTDTQYDQLVTLRNAEERTLRVFDALGTTGINPVHIAHARTRILEAFQFASYAVASPTRHSLPDDPE